MRSVAALHAASQSAQYWAWAGQLNSAMHVAALSDKEAVLFLERIATLERGRSPATPRNPEWESAFLDLIYTICSMQDSPRVCTPISLLT